LLDHHRADIVTVLIDEDSDIHGHAINDLAFQRTLHGEIIDAANNDVPHHTLTNEYHVAVPPKKDPADLVLTSLVVGFIVNTSHELSHAGVVCIITLPDTSSAA